MIESSNSSHLEAQVQDLTKKVETLMRIQQSMQTQMQQLEAWVQQNIRQNQSYSPPQHYPQSQRSECFQASDPLEPSSPQPPYQAQPTVPYPWESIVLRYGENPTALEPYAVLVSETPASLDRRRRYSASQEVTLGASSNPSYWVVTNGDPEAGCWLVPKANFKVSGPSFDTLQALFHIQGQQSQRLKLIKPASVRMSNAEEWELLDKGEVQFL